MERVHINKHYAGITQEFHSPLLTVLVDFLDEMFNVLLHIYFRGMKFLWCSIHIDGDVVQFLMGFFFLNE